MATLVLDIGGSNVKVWQTGEKDKFKFPSGPELSPEECVRKVTQEVKSFEYDQVSIGYPGDVLHGKPCKEPINLGGKWVDFDFATAFGCPVRIMNDACMQALGCYEGGRMLYVGLGTGVGSTFFIDGKIVPLALGHLSILPGGTLHEHLSRAALEERGVKAFRRSLAAAVPLLRKAFVADYVVLGGGNSKRIKELPEATRRGGNRFAYLGGLRLWPDTAEGDAPDAASRPPLLVHDDAAAIPFAGRKSS